MTENRKIILASAAGLMVGLVASHPAGGWALTAQNIPLLIGQILFFGLLFYAVAIAIWQRNRIVLIWSWTLVGALLGIDGVLAHGASGTIGVLAAPAITYVAARFLLWPKPPLEGAGQDGAPQKARFNGFGAFIVLGTAMGWGGGVGFEWPIILLHTIGGALTAYVIGRYFIWRRPTLSPAPTSTQASDSV
jgi:hypothetical protein